MSLRNTQSEWARTLVDGLIAGGVQQVVISPGSRSTPLVCAVLERPELTTYDVIDERSAGFFALGQARASGRPTVLICTSGSAGANYYPAIVEASAAAVPLLAITADRPAELTACGANQTIDQLDLYGKHTRSSFDLPPAGARRQTLVAVRRLAVQACDLALAPQPGAVHLNARADKPLEPHPARTLAEQRFAELAAAIRQRPVPIVPRPIVRTREADLEPLIDACRSHERGLIVCGPGPCFGPHEQRSWLDTVSRLSDRTGFPILADATSQLRLRQRTAGRFVELYPLLLASAAQRSEAAPALVLQLGAAPIATGWERLIDEQPPSEHWIVGHRPWHDPTQLANGHLLGEVPELLEAVLSQLPKTRDNDRWSDAWQRRGTRAIELLDQTHRENLHRGNASGSTTLRESEVTTVLVDSLPEDSTLVVGNSLPVRNLDAYCLGGSKNLSVIHQRGASGIDGLLSGAIGTATLRTPTVLLIGDVSLAHDLGALALLAKLDPQLTVVVIDNGGGRIFDHLPIARNDAELMPAVPMQHWRTAPAIDFEAVARAHGLRASTVRSRPELARELGGELNGELDEAHTGARLIRAMVDPASSLDSTRLGRQLSPPPDTTIGERAEPPE